MAFILKQAIHKSLAQTLYNEIISRRSVYHYFTGKVLEWTAPQTPETPTTLQSYEYDTRNHIVATKKINPGDASLVVRRVDWNSGVVYDQYDENYSASRPAYSGATSLKDSNFYVMTTSFNVYKCLFNNSGSASTEEPLGTDAIPVTYADEYVWKYMFTVPLSSRNKFLTEDYIPVQTSVNNSFFSDGQIEGVVIDSPGSGYNGNSAVTLTVNGTFRSGNGNVVATLVPVINDAGQFVSYKITNAGNNYSNATIVINDTEGNGTGYYNTLSTAVLTPVLYNGVLDRVLIEDPGIGYSANIQTTLSLQGDGTGASLIPYINDAGQLEDVIIENRGTGYTYLNITVVGDGIGANASVNLSTVNLDAVQSTVELAAVPGAIHAVRVANVGAGYNTIANISVTGDGSGFTGIVRKTVSNTISYIEVTNPGSGYTYATANVVSVYGSNAVLVPIMSPFGGHGKNAVSELFADTIMLYSTINNDKIHGVFVDNDYRQFGILKDPTKPGSDEKFSNVAGSPCYLVTVEDVSSLATDQILTIESDGESQFEVVQILPDTQQILITNLHNYPVAPGTILYDASTDISYIVQTVDQSPTINKFSGDLLYIDNRTSVSYSDNQLVTLRTVIKL